ncbi:CDP-alcohol phosphatidyltransferase family protein [Halobacteriales archaeon SW_7_71_33]|nr:MAG: CDP-alcohol phosphatidyltransferase family protein [Halobacteriales archaeon SW_7_71_33]
MTLDRLRPLVDRTLAPFVAGFDRLGLSPDGVSVLAFLVAVAAGGCFALASAAPAWYVAGAVLVGVNGTLDVVDGALARRQGVEGDAGDLFDHVLDRYADVAVVAGLAAGTEAYALGFAAVTGVLLTSYLGTQVEAVGLDREYGGLLGRADRLVLVAVVTTLAATLDVAGVEATLLDYGPVGWLLAVLAAVGHLTALQRFRGARRDLT